MNQKILTMTTEKPNLRAEADGWNCEMGTDRIDVSKPVGLANSGITYLPTTPLFAMARGWRLMGPPVKIRDYNDALDTWVWWFERYD